MKLFLSPTKLDPSSVIVSLLAYSLLGLLLIKAWTDLDVMWDGLAYHLPFAGLRLGIIAADDYQLTAWYRAFFDSFPVAGDWLQGLFWWIGGRPQAVNIVSWVSLVLFFVYLRRYWRVSVALATVAFLAIPLVQVHTSLAYVDLLGCVAVTVAWLTIVELHAFPDRFTWGRLGLFLLCVFLVAHDKLQYLPIAGLLLLAFAGTAWYVKSVNPIIPQILNCWWKRGLGLIIVLMIFANPLRNLVTFHNPFYPVKISIAGLNLPGQFKIERDDPHYLNGQPQVIKWLYSVVERNAYTGRRQPWNADQGGSPAEAPSFRMGGYGGFWVLVNLFFFFHLYRYAPRREARLLAAHLAVGSVFTAFLPASHELRYYLYWMLMLVASNLILLAKGDGLTRERHIYPLMATAALLFVIAVSDASYILPHYRGPQEVIHELGIHHQVKELVREPGVTLCVFDRDPYVFLYSHYFHPDLPPYRVRQSWLGNHQDVEECQFLPTLKPPYPQLPD